MILLLCTLHAIVVCPVVPAEQLCSAELLPWGSRPAALLPSWVQAVSTCFAVKCIHSTVARHGSCGHGSEAIVCEQVDAAVKRA